MADYFLIGTGDHKVADEWRQIWRRNVAAGAPGAQIVCLSVGCGGPPREAGELRLPGNLGHVGDLLSGGKSHQLCGWSASVLALAMVAYAAERDLLYFEQDCLAFGPWVSRMYADAAGKSFVFGRRMANAPYMPCAQSLFLVQHRFIPTFVQSYLELGPDRKECLPEHKFVLIEQKFPLRCGRLSFGYDRERPINFNDPVWYGQKFSETELAELRRRHLI